MPTAFIFHGTAGHSQENWFPWLKKKLEERGFEVIVPQFPTPENQTPEAWLEVFRPYQHLWDEHTLVFGHSLGGAFLLRVLEEVEVEIRAAFLVAAPIGILPIKNIATDKPFLEKSFDWETIRSRAQDFFIFHSDNDPFMNPENGKQLAGHLGVELNLVPGAGHFNTASGYTTFEALLEKVDGLTK